jgi:hypothetical protein
MQQGSPPDRADIMTTSKELDREIEGLMGLVLVALARPQQAPATISDLVQRLEPGTTPLKSPTGHGATVDALVAAAEDEAVVICRTVAEMKDFASRPWSHCRSRSCDRLQPVPVTFFGEPAHRNGRCPFNENPADGGRRGVSWYDQALAGRQPAAPF